jgi:hypothetical protein
VPSLEFSTGPSQTPTASTRIRGSDWQAPSTLPRFLVVAAGLFAAACATIPSESVKVISEGKGSDYFSLGAPAMSKSATGQYVAGRVCRLNRSTLLSPPSIRVEHLSAGGQLLDVAHAYLAEIYLARDQNCSDYAAKVSWTMGTGDIVRACFDHEAVCPAQAESKAVVKAPANP